MKSQSPGLDVSTNKTVPQMGMDGVSDIETSRCCIHCDMETSLMHRKYRFGGLMVTNLPDGAKITQQIPGETGTMMELMIAMEVIA